jgi:hypothetical protein
MSKYHFTVEVKANLVTRMYQDHGYDIDEICLRLRYPKEVVEALIKKCNLQHGKKSWRY